MRLLSLLALALLALPGCDSQYNNGYDDGYYDGQGTTRNGARFVDVSFDRDAYTVSTDNRIASFQDADIDDAGDRAALRTALAAAGDGALVVAYVEASFLIDARTTSDQTFAALPASRAFRDEIPYDVDNDGVADEFVPVETVLSYEYSFDNGNFNFDVVSSDPATDFDANALFDFAIAQDPVIRVVTVPATAARSADGRPAVDMTDYAAVKAYYGLPD